MKSVTEVRAELERLADYYTSKEFAGVMVAERGYHLVRAIDEMVYNGWFAPYKPVVNYRAKGPDEIDIEILEFQPLLYRITITKGDCKNG